MINPYELPLKIKKLYYDVELNFDSWLKSGQYDIAREKWKNVLSKIINAQKEQKRRIHKGGVFHNLGIIELFNRNWEWAFKYFVLGYTEDVISEMQGFLAGKAEDAPGGQNLKRIFGVDEAFFKTARKTIESHKDAPSINDPQIIFKILLKTQFEKEKVQENVSILDKNPFAEKEFTIDNLPGKWKNRVFVGGNYRDRFNTLMDIKKIVKQKDYEPILAVNCQNTEISNHDLCLLLLHNCKFAIFDLFTDSGYLMEVERTLDYRTKTLIVYEYTLSPPFISSMIKTLGPPYVIEKFSSKNELISLINNFLP